MSYRSIKGFTGIGQFGILMAFTGLGIVIASVVQYMIGKQLIPAGLPMDKAIEAINKALMLPENVAYARLSQVLGTFFIMFIPVILYLVICHGRNGFWVGFSKYINAKQVLIGFLLIFAANVIAGPLAELSKNLVSYFPSLDTMAKRMEDGYREQVNALSNLKSWSEFAMAIVIMAFFPALFEELFFRGALQTLLERWWKAPLLALIITSLFFSFIHMSIYLFLSRFVLGLVLGLMYQRSKNIWVNIMAHFLNNTVAVLQLFWLSRQGKTIEADKLDPKIPLTVAVLALIVLIGFLYLFEKVSAKNRMLIAFEEQNLLEKNDPVHSIAYKK